MGVGLGCLPYGCHHRLGLRRDPGGLPLPGDQQIDLTGGGQPGRVKAIEGSDHVWARRRDQRSGGHPGGAEILEHTFDISPARGRRPKIVVAVDNPRSGYLRLTSNGCEATATEPSTSDRCA